MVQVTQQRTGHLPQTSRMPMHFGTAPQGHVQQKTRLARKGIWLHRFTLDQARVAKRRFLPRVTSVHQHDVKPALLQMQSGAGTHHAGAQDKDQCAHRVYIMQQPFGIVYYLSIRFFCEPSQLHS
jgi:hypothetical protein